MKLICKGQKFEIEDKYIEYSPFLHTLGNTEVGSDVYIDPNEGIDNEYYIIDTEPGYMNTYLNFLKGQWFRLNEIEEAELFLFMGHNNPYQYPIEYWGVKLYDNWIRDNFYKHKLYEEPYYGLKEIECKKISVKLIPGTYIAGGFALYLAGWADKYNDVDIFFTDKDQLYNFLEANGNPGCVHKPNTISTTIEIGIMKFRTNELEKYIYPKTQCILRLYKSPSEIVHGFDVDCVGVIYDGKKLWATERAIYAIHNSINWFDPTRSSPSYAYRLSKYMARGFHIELPMFDAERIQYQKIDEIKKSLVNLLDEYYDFEDEYDVELFRNYCKKYAIDAPIPLNSTKVLIRNTLSKLYLSHLVRLSINPGTITIREKVREILYNDHASVLILASQFRCTSLVWKCSDYDPKEEEGWNYEYKNIQDCKIQWKEQNPMEQVSSTFYPTPIQDLKEWYKTSPLYK